MTLRSHRIFVLEFIPTRRLILPHTSFATSLATASGPFCFHIRARPWNEYACSTDAVLQHGCALRDRLRVLARRLYGADSIRRATANGLGVALGESVPLVSMGPITDHVCPPQTHRPLLLLSLPRA